MSYSPNTNLVQRTIDLNYAKKKRTASLKWFFINVFFFVLFTYDLTCIGHCPATWAGYIELTLASLACVSALRHGVNLIPRRSSSPAKLSRQQLKLLGLTDADLDSSLVLAEKSALSVAEKSGGSEAQLSLSLSLSLSPGRWRGAAGAEGGRASPHSPAASPRPPSPPPAPPAPFAPSLDVLSRDRFIADQHSLSDYLKEYEQSARQAEAGAVGVALGAAPPPHYHLSAQDTENSKLDEGSPQGSPQVYWQLDIDPQKLTQWNLNLRLWIHMTILERLVAEMELADAALARLAGGEARLGGVGAERLRQLAAGGAGERLRALLPFLEPFADQRYVVRRIRQLARAPCLSGYRWDGGGADWDAAQPTDAELVLHLFATYLDSQMTHSGNPRPFSTQYLSAGAGGVAGGRALGLHRVSARPPHWALWLRGELCCVARGRNNLLHALLLLLAAAARHSPPALARTHLGPAGLNMLWIIGR